MIEEKKEEFELRTVNTDQKEGTEEGNKSQDPKSKIWKIFENLK